MKMHRSMRAFAVFSLLTLATAALAACGDDSDEPDGDGASGSNDSGSQSTDGDSAEKDPYVLGLVVDLTGPLSYLGRPNVAAFETVAHSVNAAGGINGHPLQLEIRNDESNVEETVRQLRDLLRQEPVAMSGFVSSTNWGAAAPIVQAESDLAFIPMTYAPDLAGLENVISSVTSTEYSAELQYKFAAELAESKGMENFDVGIIRGESVSATAWSETVHKSADEDGVEVVVEATMPFTASSADAQAAAVVGANPDIVMGYFTESIEELSVRALRQRGFEGPIIQFWGSSSDETLERLKDPEYYHQRDYVDPESPDNPDAETMFAAAEEAGVSDGDLVDRGFTASYVAAQLIVAALESCADPCGSADFLEALRDVEYDPGELGGDLALDDPNGLLGQSARYYAWNDESGAVEPVGDWVYVGS